MANQNEADVVTIKEAIDKVKKWADEKDYEKVKEGSEEILEVEPDNEDIKKLLADAEAALGGTVEVAETPIAPEIKEEPVVAEPKVAEEPAVTPEPVAAPEPISKPAPAPESPAAEEAPLKVNLEDEAPAEPEVKAEEPAPKPEVAPAPAEDAMPDFGKKEEEKSVVNKLPEIEEEPKKKDGLIGKIVLVVILLAILAGLVYAYLQGWINPVLDYILGLLGL